ISTGHTITVIFKILSYEIATSVTGNGSISPEGPVFAEYGSDQTFTITPDAGYQVTSVIIDDNPAGQISSYTFSNVTGDHSILAVFEIVTDIGNKEAGPREKAISSINPNPSKGDFSIYFNRNYFSLVTNISLRIIDPDGRIIYQEELPTTEILRLGMKQINLAHSVIENGVYFVELNLDGKKEVWKVVFGK
ncbi:MAG: T9SS type A sorting domain-containing protein, partial [Bacteroidales bacterium]|nr:T9SS type A sorting domain-containing protein [Bacteroidales bacterium]